MLYAKIKNGQISTIASLKSLYPNTSFSISGPSIQWLRENNLMPVLESIPFDHTTQRLIKIEPVISGDQVVTCQAVDLTVEELSAIENNKNLQLAAQVRASRDRLLTASDWTQLADVVLLNKTEWATYRQALRDLTNQAGFPQTITWPIDPNGASNNSVNIVNTSTNAG